MARQPIHMPKYGMTMTEGIITEWHFQEGDTVSEGDALLDGGNREGGYRY